MRLLLIGDIVGKPGRKVVEAVLPLARKKYSLDFVVANAENSAGGSGITRDNYHELIDYGVDCITLGDHAFKKKEIFETLDAEKRIVRPGNLPQEAPGKRFTILTAPSGVQVGVFCLLGRVFMSPVDCPFRAADLILGEIRQKNPELKAILLDFHAEATSDKQLMGRYLDGRISAVLGTHTHVATADEQILPGGTAFQCDVGMTGPFESIIGRKISKVLESVRTFRPTTYDVATGDLRMCGTVVEIDSETGQATKIERICIRAA
ncbi:MAG: TIGR00282 family metallophosphoesterase [Planctomycetaceae bacterium]|nr:TIGR00282 family metallophosphoesterase [Planctomycetaceae bacterium]